MTAAGASALRLKGQTEFIDTVAASEVLNLRNFDLPGDMVSLLWSSLEPDGPYSTIGERSTVTIRRSRGAKVEYQGLKLTRLR